MRCFDLFSGDAITKQADLYIIAIADSAIAG